jgi:hypothetical protein
MTEQNLMAPFQNGINFDNQGFGGLNLPRGRDFDYQFLL